MKRVVSPVFGILEQEYFTEPYINIQIRSIFNEILQEWRKMAKSSDGRGQFLLIFS